VQSPPPGERWIGLTAQEAALQSEMINLLAG
jgi:hypothetical protein